MNIKTVLSKVLQIDDLVLKKHSHANESTLDTISQSNINNWNDKYSKNEVDNKINQVITSMDWKEAVSTYSALATTYPTPDDGWTVNVKDTDYTYRYSGSSWIPISANSIPLASSSVDGKMSKQDKIDHDDMNSKKHTHSNKSIIDTITQSLIDYWNAAYSHISDAVRHITSDERTLWNSVSNKSNIGHTHDDRYYTETEINNIVGSETLTTTSATLKGAINEVKATVSSGGSVANADKLDNMEPSTNNSGNTIVQRDSNGNFSAGTISATLNGNASTATKLSSVKNITITGDATGITPFDGSGDSSIGLTLANSGVTVGTYKSVTVDSKGRVTGGTNPTTLSEFGITDAAPIANPTFTGTATLPTTSLIGHIYSSNGTERDFRSSASGGNGFYVASTGSGLWDWGNSRNVIAYSPSLNALSLMASSGKVGTMNNTLDDGNGNMIASGLMQGNQLKSTISTGSSPISVMSTTVVPNLNVDLLDGKHATDFASSSHTHTNIVHNDTRSNNFAPIAYDGLSIHLKSNGIDGLTDGGAYHGVLHIQQWNDIIGGQTHQLAFTDNGNIFHRKSTDASTWGNWERLLTNKQGLTWNDIKGV